MKKRHLFITTGKKTAWLVATVGALAIAPMTVSSATANADSVDWDAIAQCESGGNWSTNTGNGMGRRAVRRPDGGDRRGLRPRAR